MPKCYTCVQIGGPLAEVSTLSAAFVSGTKVRAAALVTSTFTCWLPSFISLLTYKVPGYGQSLLKILWEDSLLQLLLKVCGEAKTSALWELEGDDFNPHRCH